VVAGGRVTQLYPQPYGPKLVLADDQMTVGLFSPLTDEVTQLPGFEGNLELVGKTSMHAVTAFKWFCLLARTESVDRELLMISCCSRSTKTRSRVG
jgi:hypothetical protein